MKVSAVELMRLQARDEQLRVLQDLSGYVAERGGEVVVSDARRAIGLNDLRDGRRLCHWAAAVLLLDRVRTRAGQVYRLRGAPARGVRPNVRGKAGPTAARRSDDEQPGGAVGPRR